MVPVPPNRAEAIDLIDRAFASCRQPTLDELANSGGIDGPTVVVNWGRMNRASVLELDFFGDFLAEDLGYMSSVGLRYFLPSVMVLFLRYPERIDFGGFLDLVSRLEGLVGLNRFHDDGFYRPVVLNPDQRASIRAFCGQLKSMIKKFHLGSHEAEYLKRLTEVRKHVLSFRCDEDYDAELFQAQRRKHTTRRTPKIACELAS